jgi:peptidylprolyl isomerase
MGFYEKASERTAILSVKLAAELPPTQRENIQVLRTGSPTFAALIDAARHGHSAFYPTPVGKLGICDIHAPVRVAGKPL